jgi:hypothetical protein
MLVLYAVIGGVFCAILCFGLQYANSCTTIWFQDSPIKFCDVAKYLGVQLQSCKEFSIDLNYRKVKFYRAFNSLFCQAAKLHSELTTLHLISSYCRSLLL